MTGHGPLANTGAAINLVAGTKYNITMEYFQGTGGGETAQLLYNPLGSGFVIIPQTQLFPNFTSAPGVPINLTAVGGSSLVNLGWTYAQNDITFNVLRGTKSGGPYTTIATGLAGRGLYGHDGHQWHDLLLCGRRSQQHRNEQPLQRGVRHARAPGPQTALHV